MKLRKKFSLVVALAVLLSLLSVPAISYGAAKTKAAPKYTVKLSKTVYTIKKGKTVKLKATCNKAAKTKKLQWSSSNKKVATVSKSGKIKAKKNGKTVITVQVKGTKVKASCRVIVGTPVSKVKLNKTSLSLKTGQTFRLKAALSPKKPTIRKVTWKSSNKAVASITASGTVKAGKTGTAKITATAADGTGKLARCTVQVKGVDRTVAATGIALNKSGLGMEPGQTEKLTATVSPSNATDKTVQWKSSDTDILTVGEDGTITAHKEGNATVTACTSNGKRAVCSVKIAYKSTVSNQTELDHALTSKMVSSILYQSDVADSITIQKGDYSSKDITIDAPRSEVTNNGKFSKVTIEAIAQNTYVENEKNLLYFNASRGRLVIGPHGAASINLSSEGNQNVQIENNGSITGIDVSAKTELHMAGKNPIPVTLRQGAAGSLIHAAATLDITSSVKWNMNILPGGENTKAKIENEQCMPEVAGLGCIPVRVLDKNDIVNILAEMSDSLGINQNVTVTGNVTEYTLATAGPEEETSQVSKDSSEGADIYWIPYKKSNHDMESRWETCIQGVTPVKTVQGSYTIPKQKIGNYWMVVRKDGFAPVVKYVGITSSNSSTYTSGEVALLSDEIAHSGPAENISGNIVNGLTGKPVDVADLQVRLRAGNGNVTGNVLAKAVTDSSGRYTITKEIPAGVYTLEVLDLRQNISADAEQYNSMAQDIVVAADYLDTDNYNCIVNPQMQSDTGKGQIQFTLGWGTQESGASADIDSHLIGPKADGNGSFHVYYNDKGYYHNDIRMADLDVDDTFYEGPEHTTIYKETDGIYRFYVRNFSERETRDSDMMKKSGITVTITAGTSTYTRHCPNKNGNLWYVCDYNSATNTITMKDEMSTFLGDEGWIGLSEEERNQLYLDSAKEDAFDALASFEQTLSAYCENAKKQEYVNMASQWKAQLNSATSVMAVKALSLSIEEEEYSLLWGEGIYPTLTADNLYQYYCSHGEYWGEDGQYQRYRFYARCMTKDDGIQNLSAAPDGNVQDVELSRTEDANIYTAYVTLKNGLKYDMEVKVITGYDGYEESGLQYNMDSLRYRMIGFEQNEALNKIKSKLDEIESKGQVVRTEAEMNNLEKDFYDLEKKAGFDDFNINSIDADLQILNWYSDVIEKEDEYRRPDYNSSKCILRLQSDGDAIDDGALEKIKLGFEGKDIIYTIENTTDPAYQKLIKATDSATGLTKHIYIEVMAL